MRVYRLNINPANGEVEGEDLDEYFSSERAARLRRKEIIDRSDANPGDLAIERLEVSRMPLRALVLAILNGKGYVSERVEVVPPWDPAAEAVERGEYDP